MKPYYETELGRLWHGDCLEGMENIERVDLTLTDPPYGINKAEWDNKYIPVEKIIMEKSIAAVVNCGEQNIAECVINFGEHYKGLFYGWNRNGMTRGPLGYMNIIVAVCAGKLKRGMNFCKFTIKDLTRKNHPSPKPVEYYKQCICRFSDEQDIVFDPFIGSGTTGVACEQLNRRWIGIEISEQYCEIAAKRIEAEAKQLKMF